MFNGKIHYKWPFSIAFCMFTSESMVNCQLNCCFSRYFASIVNHLSYLSLKIENLSIDLTSGAAMPRHRASPCGSGATERRRCWGMIKRKYQ
jgi:hypothetical protein